MVEWNTNKDNMRLGKIFGLYRKPETSSTKMLLLRVPQTPVFYLNYFTNHSNYNAHTMDQPFCASLIWLYDTLIGGNLHATMLLQKGKQTSS